MNGWSGSDSYQATPKVLRAATGDKTSQGQTRPIDRRPEGQPAARPKDLHAESDITAQRPRTMTLRTPESLVRGLRRLSGWNQSSEPAVNGLRASSGDALACK